MAKNYKTRSSGGGRFKGLNASDLGLSAQAKASKVQIDALKLRAAKQKEYSRDYETGLRQTGDKEIENAKYLQGLENNIYNTKLNNIKKRAETEVDSIRGKAEEARRESDFWMQLAPKYASQLAQTGIKLGKWADRRAAQKALRENTKIDSYFDPNTLSENLNSIAWEGGFKTVLTEIERGDFSNATVFTDVELSKSESKASLFIEKYNENHELFDQSFRAELKPGELTHETAVELRVEYGYKFLADAGVHPATRGAKKFIDKQIALGKKESNNLYDSWEAGKNMDRLENLFKVYKGSAGTPAEGENLNDLILAIGTLKRLDGDGNVIYPDKGDTYADWGSKTVDYFIKNMKAGEYSSLQDLLDTRFSTLVFPTPSTDSKGRDFDDPNADLSVRGKTNEFWNTKHGKRFLREHTESFVTKYKKITSDSKVNDQIQTDQDKAYIDLITTDEDHENYYDINDRTPGGGAYKFAKYLDSLPKGSTQHTYGAAKLVIDPSSHNSLALVTKLQNFAEHDLSAFSFILGGLNPTERKKLEPMFKDTFTLRVNGGSIKDLSSALEKILKERKNTLNMPGGLSEAEDKLIKHAVNVIRADVLKEIKDNPDNAKSIINNRYTEEVKKIINKEGLYDAIEPSEAAPASGAKTYTYKYFSSARLDYRKGLENKKLEPAMKKYRQNWDNVVNDTTDPPLLQWIGEEYLGDAAKDIEDGGTIFYNEKVKSISKKFKQPYWKVLNKALELQGLPQRAKPDPEAFLQAKGIDTSTIDPVNYFGMNTYTDIVDNIELADNPFWEKIPMRYEMKTYFESGNNLEATLERIAVEKNQTPHERIKTKRHFSGLIQWQ